MTGYTKESFIIIYITIILAVIYLIMKELYTNSDLSKKETEVLNALAKGYLYKEIAAGQQISINTVKKHCKNIYKKLEVRNRTEASNVFLNHYKTA